MAITVSETAAQYVANVLQQTREQEEPINLGKVTVRVPEETISLLDYVGSKLRMSRSALAAELLSRAVQEALIVVGLPSDGDEFDVEEYDREEPSIGAFGKRSDMIADAHRLGAF